MADQLPDQATGRDMRSLTAKIADELRHNDECGSRQPMLDDEYMDDAAAILRIVSEHKGDALLGSGPINTIMAERDRLRAENEALKVELDRVNALARDRDDYLFAVGKVIKRYEESLFNVSVETDEQEASNVPAS